MKQNTINFYNSNARTLVDDYNQANMKDLHKVIEKYLIGDMRILDIGFGSGRDLNNFSKYTKDIWGIDASQEFVDIFKKKFPQFKEKVFQSIFPEIKINELSDHSFDLIYSVATWMHIPKEEYSEAIRNIKKNIKDNGIFILSYSFSPRYNDPRFFEKIDPNNIIAIFKRNGFTLLESKKSDDSLARTEIKWITQVFRYKKQSKDIL